MSSKTEEKSSLEKKPELTINEVSVGETVYLNLLDDYNTWEPATIIEINEENIVLKNFWNKIIKRKTIDVGKQIRKRK